MSEASTTVDKAIAVLFELHGADSPCGVSELGRSLGLGKSTVHRLLSSLSRRGLVERDDGGRYRPGVGLLALGLGVLEREPIAAAARELLERESAATGETAFLTVARNHRIFVVEKAEGAGLLRVAPRIGAEVPVHATAVGKLQLAFGPDRVRLPPEPWKAFTARTPRRWRELRPEIERARRRGWAENRDEWILGLSVVAAPISLAGAMAGCFVIAAPTTRVTPGDVAGLAKRVQAAAAEVGRRMLAGGTNR
jgi:DNA-binding IclR family transcriptional regulator